MAFNQFKSSILGSSAVGLLGLSAVAFCSEAAGAQTVRPDPTACRHLTIPSPTVFGR